jgi:hypothetical protein
VKRVLMGGAGNLVVRGDTLRQMALSQDLRLGP